MLNQNAPAATELLHIGSINCIHTRDAHDPFKRKQLAETCGIQANLGRSARYHDPSASEKPLASRGPWQSRAASAQLAQPVVVVGV